MTSQLRRKRLTTVPAPTTPARTPAEWRKIEERRAKKEERKLSLSFFVLLSSFFYLPSPASAQAPGGPNWGPPVAQPSGQNWGPSVSPQGGPRWQTNAP